MTLNELKRTYMQEASTLGDYESMSKTYLANKYCDEEEAMWASSGDEARMHDVMRGKYLAALMVRYWSKVMAWKTNEAASLNQGDEEYASMLYNALWVAFYYRQWRYEWKAKVRHGKFEEWVLDEKGEKIPNPYYYLRDDTAVDKIIKRCCISVRGKEYQAANKDVRRANVLLYSIDAQKQEFGDTAMRFIGAYKEEESDGVKDLVNAYIKRNKWVEALIVDSIVQENPFKIKKEKRTIFTEENGYENQVFDQLTFDQRALAKHLREIDAESLKNFCCKYDILDEVKVKEAVKKLKPTTINTFIKKTLTEIKHDEKLLSCIK